MRIRFVIALWLVLAGQLTAETRTFVLGGQPVTLEDMSTQTAVFLRALRPIPGAKWAVDVVVSNTTTQAIAGPLVLRLTDAQNIGTGFVGAALDDSQAAYFDLGALVGTSGLSAGTALPAFTITFGRNDQVPRFAPQLFATPGADGGRIFLARTLTADGLPLEGVVISEIGPPGPSSYHSEKGGWATLPDPAGLRGWRFSKTGDLDAFSLRPAGASGVTELQAARLSAATSETATPLSAASLPAPLPLGWTPLAARQGTGPVTASVPPGRSSVGAIVLVSWDATALGWVVQDSATAAGGAATFRTAPAGLVAAVVADAGAGAPAPVTTGQPLTVLGNPVSVNATWKATGQLAPVQSAASADATMVTSVATVTFSTGQPVPSGLSFPCDVSEEYVLRDGSRRVPPRHTITVTGYRADDTRPGSLTATFPVRPLQLLPGEQLAGATVRVDVLSPGEFAGEVTRPEGGALASDRFRLLVGSGDVTRPQAARLRALPVESLTNTLGNAARIAAAFELEISGITPGRRLEPNWATLAPDANYVLARAVFDQGRYGFEPVERFQSDGTGVLRSIEPAPPVALGGVDRGGLYALLQTAGAAALIQGAVTDSHGGTVASAFVQVAPWSTFSDAKGTYRLLAVAGTNTVTVADTASGETATAVVAVASDLTEQSLDLATARHGPRLIQSSPADGDQQVALNAPLTLRFDKPINPATLVAPNAIQLMATNGDLLGISLLPNLARTEITLVPAANLPPAQTLRILLGESVQDTAGFALEGTRQVAFTTQNDFISRPDAGLTIHEPANGLVAISGGAGLAEPASPVILVNETTGSTTTILSLEDGSFTNNIIGGADDIIAAVLVNRNGTRNTVPASRQVFRDGSVGLFAGGGTVEATTDQGPIRVVVDSGAIPQKTVIKLDPLPVSDLLAAVGNVPPVSGRLLQAVRYQESGDPLTRAAHISVPVREADLGLPTGVAPEDGGYALVLPHNYDGVTVYEIVDRMRFERQADGTARLITKSPPFVGLLANKLNALAKATRRVDLTGSNVLSASVSGPADVQPALSFGVITFNARAGQEIAGQVVSVAVDGQGIPRGPTQPVPGASVMVDFSGDRAPGTLSPGEFVATSDDTGNFGFFYRPSQAGIGRDLIATHLRFPFQVANAPAGAFQGQGLEVARVELRFALPDPVTVAGGQDFPPAVTPSWLPLQPAAGLTNGRGADLTLLAVDDLQVGAITLVGSGFLDQQGRTLNVTNLVITAGLTNSESPARVSQAFHVQAAVPGRATLTARVSDTGGHLVTRDFSLVFGAAAVGSDPGSGLGPRVSFNWPPDGSQRIPAYTPIVLRFSHAVAAGWLAGTNVSWVTLDGQHRLLRVEGSNDRREAKIYYDGASDGKLSLTVGSPLGDDNGAAFDQDPSQTGQQPYTLTFSTAGSSGASLDTAGGPYLQGGGAVFQGAFAYTLERQDATSGRLLAFDLSEPTAPVQAAAANLNAWPTTLSLIPLQDLRLGVAVTNGHATGGSNVTSSVIAVFTGSANDTKQLVLQPALTNLKGTFSPNPSHIVLSENDASEIVRSKWDPPYLGFFELGSDFTGFSLIDLNSALIFATQPDLLSSLPLDGAPGLDLNGDGDYCDDGEYPPLPSRRRGIVPGLAFSWAPTNRLERLQDFDFASGAGLAVAITAFNSADPGLFRVVLAPGTNAVGVTNVVFGANERAKRVLLLPAQTVNTTNGPEVYDLALVSLSLSSTPDGVLDVIDISRPESPRLLNRIPLPPGEGIPGSISRLNESRLVVAGSRNQLLLDVSRLLDGGSGPVHPAWAGSRAGTGGGARDFVADVSGINLAFSGTNKRVTQSEPQFQFLTLNAVLNPTQLVNQPARQVANILRAAKTVNVAEVQALPTNGAPPFDATRHYYVLMDAPGGNGAVLPLVLSAVDSAGMPQRERLGTAVPAVIGDPQIINALTVARVSRVAVNIAELVAAAVSGEGEAEAVIEGPALVTKLQSLLARANGLADAIRAIKKIGDQIREIAAILGRFPTQFKAHRLSDDPSSPLFNRYLAGPFLVLGGAPELQTIDALQAQAATNGLDRVYLRPSPRIWVGLPSSSRPLPDAPVQKLFGSSFRLNPRLNLPGVTIPDQGELLAKLGGSTTLIVTVIIEQLNTLPLVNGQIQPQLLPGAHALLAENYADRPVVLVPGFAGSRLKVDGTEQWLGLLQRFSGSTNEPLQLTPDGQPSSPSVKVEVTDVIRNTIETPAFKPIYGEWIKFMTSRLGLLEYDYLSAPPGVLPGSITPAARRRLDGNPNFSQQPAPDLFIYPYDWRLDDNLSAQGLRDYVRLVREMHPDADGIDLVGHSNGGLVARAYMLLPGQRALVKRFITVGTPWLGAVKPLQGLKTGDLDDFGVKVAMPIGATRRTLQFAPAAHQLLPSKEYFQLGYRPLVEDGYDINTNGVSHDTFDYDGFLDALGHRFLREPAAELGLDLDQPGAVHPAVGNITNFRLNQPIGDQRGDPANDVEVHEIVGMNASPDTMVQLRVRGRIFGTTNVTNIVISPALLAVRETEEGLTNRPGFLSSSNVDGRLPFATTNQFRLRQEVEVRYGSGDGTAPIGSLTRGYKSAQDLNPPGTHLYAIVGGTGDTFTGHNDMLKADEFLEMFGRIYAARPVSQLQPHLSPPASAKEGDLATFGFDSGPIQAGVDLSSGVSFVIDYGDGVVELHHGSSALHRYLQSGTYLVCLAASAGNGVYGFVSQQVTVSNVAPTVEIEGGDITVNRGETRIMVATVTDPGLEDRHTFNWTLPPGNYAMTNQFAVPVTFSQAGTNIVQVTATDSDGATNSASVTVTVRDQAPVAVPALAGPNRRRNHPLPQGVPVAGFEGGNPEILVRVTGHAPGASDTTGIGSRQLTSPKSGGGTTLAQDFFAILDTALDISGLLPNSSLTGIYNTILLPRLNLFLGQLAKDAEYARLQRSFDGPTTAQVVALGRSAPTEVDVSYIEGGRAKSLDRYQITVETNQGIRLTYEWEQRSPRLEVVSAPSVPTDLFNATFVSNAPPVFHTDDEVQASDRLGPAVVGVRSQLSDNLQVFARDNFTATSNLNLYIAYDANANGRFDDDVFYPLQTNYFVTARLQSRPFTIIGEDAQGNVGDLSPFLPGSAPQLAPDAGTVCDGLDKIRVAVRDALQEALTTGFITNLYLLSPAEDVWILEQGSGACLWKTNACAACQGVYQPGRSDNDYEVFLPVSVSDNYQFNDADRARFMASGPYASKTFQGDWYFRPPVGIDNSGLITTNDADITQWQFTPPNSVSGTAVAASFSVPRLADDSDVSQGFHSPLTPANVITLWMFHAVTNDPARRALVPEVSFFPERREHFMYGVLHLSLPPAFGDDATGDAGAGRQLLLLKWLLEGAYVSGGGSGAAAYNVGAPELPKIWNYWQLAGIPPAEGYEWGVLQEHAALRSGALNYARALYGAEGAPQLPHLADCLDQQAMKKVGKLGKAAVRAALARLATDPSTADFARSHLSPAEYASTGARSFEEFAVTEIHRSGMDQNLFGDFATAQDDQTGPPDLDDFLKAKLGNEAYLSLIVSSPDFYVRYVTNTFLFLHDFVQVPTLVPYTNYLSGLYRSQSFEELNQRGENIGRLLYGTDDFYGIAQLRTNRNPGAPILVPAVSDFGPAASAANSVKAETESARGKRAPGGPPPPYKQDFTLAADQTVLFGDAMQSSGVTTAELPIAIGDSSVTVSLSSSDAVFDLAAEMFKTAVIAMPVPGNTATAGGAAIFSVNINDVLGEPLTDHPETNGVSLRSPTRYLGRGDGLMFFVLPLAGGAPGRFSVRVHSETSTDPIDVQLQGPFGAGVFYNTNPMRLGPNRDISIIDEELLTMELLENGAVIETRTCMVDLAEIAAGGLDLFYRASDQSPVMNGATNGPIGFTATVDTDFNNNIGSTPLNGLSSLAIRAGSSGLDRLEADILHLSVHGQTNGDLEDDRGRLLFRPEFTADRAAGRTVWESDLEWAVLAACLTLSEDKPGEGVEHWIEALRGNRRRMHGILGAYELLDGDLRDHYRLFWESLNQRKPVVESYINAMQSGTIGGKIDPQPWAALYWEFYTNETLVTLKPDLVGPIGRADRPFYENATYLNALTAGGVTRSRDGLVGTNRDEFIARLDRLAVPARAVPALRMGLSPVLNAWSDGEYAGGAAQTPERRSWGPRISRGARSRWNREQAVAEGLAMLTNRAPDLARRLSLSTVGVRQSSDEAGVAAARWTNGYHVVFDVNWGGAPVWTDNIQVFIAGDQISEVLASVHVPLPGQALEAVAVTDARTAFAVAEREAPTGAIPYGAYLTYVPESLIRANATGQLFRLCWRFQFLTSAEGQEKRHSAVIWVDAATGQSVLTQP